MPAASSLGDGSPDGATRRAALMPLVSSFRPHARRAPAPRPATGFLATAAVGALVAGCASGVAASEGPSRTIVGSSTSTTSDVVLYRDGRAARERVPAAPAAVWALLPDVYAALGLPGAPALGRERTLVAQPRIRRVLNGVPLSRYLECGRTATGELSADVYTIQLTVMTSVEPDSGGSLLATQVRAIATAVSSANSPVDCASTGTLEARLGEALAARMK